MTDGVLTKAELLTNIRDSWNDLASYLKTLTEAQLTVQTDAAGWTVKDHLVHVATWEEDMCVLLAGHCRWEALNIDKSLLLTDNFDAINAVIQKRRASMGLVDTLRMLEANHHRLMEALQPLSDQDLKRAYRSYQPDSTLEYPIFGWIKGCTYQHFEEHLGWIRTLIADNQDKSVKLASS